MIRSSGFHRQNAPAQGGAALPHHPFRRQGYAGRDPAPAQGHGYDFVALTDHRNYNFKNFAPETGLIVVPGMEMDRSIPGQPGIHCFHTVVLGREKDKGNPYEQDQRFESGAVSERRTLQPLLDEYHRNGQITLYCHPEWSGTPAREFEKMCGNFAMEIWNSGCVLENGMDTNAAWWDEILMQGQKLYGCATDDGHSMDQHCKGWVCVERGEKRRFHTGRLVHRRVLLLYRPERSEDCLHRKRRGDGGLFTLRGDRIPRRPIPLQARIRRRGQADARDLPLPGGDAVSACDGDGRAGAPRLDRTRSLILHNLS